MRSPFDLSGDGTYVDLRQRVLRALTDGGAKDRMVTIAQHAFDDFIRSENIGLDPAEKKRLFRDVLKSLFEDAGGNAGQGRPS